MKRGNNGKSDAHPRLGIAFSGGASRGFAHIGVLQALKEANIRPDLLAGTSIGALIAAMYAFGVALPTMREQAEAMSWLRIARLNIPRTGILSNEVLGEIVRKHLGDVAIEDSPIPLAVVCTNIANGDKVVLREGNLARAIMASSAIPGVYTPVQVDRELLVDGFLVENVPILPLQDMGAEVILGVHLGRLIDYRPPSSITNIMLNAFEIAIDAHALTTMQYADVIIEPRLERAPDTGRADRDDKALGDLYYRLGYAAGRNALAPLVNAAF